MKRKLLGLLIATSSLLAISCSQSEDFVLLDNGGDGEEVTVSFSVSADDGTLSTRAGETVLPHISDGTKATTLIYAVYSPEYDEDGNITSYYLLKQYGDKGIEGNGQTVVENQKDLLGDGYTFSLRLMRGKTYLIAFWAQDPECKAYDTDDLENVTVDYTAAKNNDELRDAFSTTISFVALPENPQKAILTRAMAQINVGTAGWDYLEEVDYGYRYAYSKMEVTGVYNQLNVLTEKVSIKEGSLTEGSKELTATFDWNKLPAYINIPDEAFPALPAGDVKQSDMKKLEEFLLKTKAEQTDEEFLYVKLTPKGTAESDDQYEEGQGNYKNNKFLKYLEDSPDKNTSVNINNVYTEVFKYLSMCYVLAPKHTPSNSGDTFENGTFTGGTTVAVNFYMAEDEKGNIYDYKKTSQEDGDETLQEDSEETETLNKTVTTEGNTIFKIVNVPVQRNWRTNILGGTGLNDNDDNTSLFDPRSVRCLIDIDPGFDGEHNTTDSGASWGTWNPDGSGDWQQTDKWPKDEDPENE